MAALSDYMENILVDAILRGTSFPSPPAAYVGLHLSAPTDMDTGFEVAAGGYLRQLITFAPPVSGVTQNNAVVNFPMTTASWGTVTHFGIYDSAASGNLLMWGRMSEPRTIDSGDFFTIPANTLSISFD